MRKKEWLIFYNVLLFFNLFIIVLPKINFITICFVLLFLI